MRQAIHILKKDLRQFRVAIGILLVLTIAFAGFVAEPWSTISDSLHVSGLAEMARPAPPLPSNGVVTGSGSLGSVTYDTVPGELLEPFLILLWCYLIARVIQTDALTDDRQFWLTRPYRRGSLWAAKAMFVLLVVNLPIGLAQIWIVMRDGLPLAPNLAGLLWEQVLLTLIVTLPAVVLASVTTTLGHLVLVAVISWAAAVVTFLLSPSWGGLAWLPYAVVLAVAMAVASIVLFFQFMRRRTRTSRTALISAGVVGMVACPFLPWAPFYAIQSRLTGAGSSAHMELVLPSAAIGPRYGSTDTLDLQFKLSSGSETTMVACDAVEVTIETPSHATWRSGVIPMSSNPQVPGGCLVEVVVLNHVFFEAAVDQKVNIHATLSSTIFGDEQATVLRPGAPAKVVPGIGTCAVLASDDHGSAALTWCRTAFRSPSALVTNSFLTIAGATRIRNAVSYSPFPADFRLGPVGEDYQALTTSSDGSVTVKTARPIAHIRTDIDARNVRLGDFEFGVAGKG